MGLDTAEAIQIQDLQDTLEPLPPVADLLSLAQQTHPELKAHEFKVESSVAEVDRIRSERYPALSLTARYGFVDAFDGSLNAQWLAAMNVKVPLFDFGLIRKKAEVARAKVIEEEQQRLNFQLNIEQEIHERYLQLQELDDYVQLLNTQIEQATEEMKLNRAMFKQELAPQAAVLDAETALLKLQLALTQAQYERRLRRLQLSLVTGEWTLPSASR
jgi:outer membrane protein